MYIRRSKKAWEMIKGPIQFETEFMIPSCTHTYMYSSQSHFPDRIYCSAILYAARMAV